MTKKYFYCHPRQNGRRAIYSLDEPAPAIRSVNRPMPKDYKPHPGDAHVKDVLAKAVKE